MFQTSFSRLLRIPLFGASFALATHSARADDGGPFELQAMVGHASVNLSGFSEDRFLDARPSRSELASIDDLDEGLEAQLEASQVEADGSGISAGLGAQLRLWILVLGARYAYSDTADFGAHTLGADLGLRLGRTIALYGRGGAGLAFLGGLPEGMNANGYYLDLGAGLDVRFTDAISVGVGADMDFLFLGSTAQFNSAAGALSGELVSEETASEVDGSAVGFIFRPQIHVTWHL
jgi:hypothetical protein